MNGDESIKEFINLFNEIIEQQSVILGPDIATIIARKVKGLQISDEGKVYSLEGDPRQLLETLINEYVGLSGLIVKKTIEPLLTKHSALSQDTQGKSETQATVGSPSTEPKQPTTISQEKQPSGGGSQ